MAREVGDGRFVETRSGVDVDRVDNFVGSLRRVRC